MNTENRKEWRPTAGIAMVIALVALYTGGYLLLSARMPPRKEAATSTAICAAMPQMLRAMKQTLSIDVYVSPVDDNLKAFEKSLEAVLAQYKASGGGKVDYHITEVIDAATRAKALAAGAQDQPWSTASGTAGNALGNPSDATRVFNGLVLHYGKEKATMPFIEPSHPEGLEFWVTSKLREIVAKEDGRAIKVGILVGHGEFKLTDRNLVPGQMGVATIQTIISQNMPYYTLVPIDLQGGAVAIDDSISGLVVTQPSVDLVDAELARIDDFVMKGRSLAVFASAANVHPGDGKMHATLSTHGLEKLLAGYGVELRPDVLLDFVHTFSLHAQGANGPEEKTFPMVLVAPTEDLDVTFPAFFRLHEIAFPLPSSIVLHAEKQPQARVRVLARSSATASRVVTPEVDLDPLKDWKPEGTPAKEQQTVAASVEGTLRSAFGAAKSARPTRVLVVASSEYLSNPFARASNPPEHSAGAVAFPPADPIVGQIAGQYMQRLLSPTIVSFKNALDWLAPEDPFTACPAVLPVSPAGAASGRGHGRPPPGAPRPH